MAKKPTVLDWEDSGRVMTDFIQPLLRFVCRPSSDRKGAKPDLVLGACFKNQAWMKAGRVYEVRNVLGEIQVVDMGPAAIGSRIAMQYPPEEGGTVFGRSWGSSANELLGVLGKNLFLTVAEQKEQCEQSNPKPTKEPTHGRKETSNTKT